jgi:hypothetical protein
LPPPVGVPSGFPFFYSYRFMWVPITSLLIWIQAESCFRIAVENGARK